MLPSFAARSLESLAKEGGREEGSYVHPTTFKAARGVRQIELERRRRLGREGGESRRLAAPLLPSLPQYSRWGKCETDTRAHSAFSQAGKKWGGREGGMWAAGRAAILGRCFLGRISINQVRMETYASLKPKIMGKPAPTRYVNTDQGELRMLALKF